MLKTVSDQPHIAKNVAYWLRYYGIAWILVRQGHILDQEFGHNFLLLLGNTFRQGLLLCGSMSCQLFGFYMVQVSVERCFRIYFRFYMTSFFLLLIVSWGRHWGVQFWQSYVFELRSKVGLYRDDGTAIIHQANGPKMDRIRKDINTLFKSEGLSITVATNMTETDFVDVSFNLEREKCSSYRRPNNIPFYIHSQSNHSPSITK